MPNLNSVRRHWDAMASIDPYWAICTTTTQRGQNVDLDAFFASGRTELASDLDLLAKLGMQVPFDATALDFGCGIGRLTQALAERFARCAGVDISPVMLEQAVALNRWPDRCQYILNERSDLAAFADATFVFAYSTAVLQHMPPRYGLRYLAEMLRVLAPGGILVVRVPHESGGRAHALLQTLVRVRSHVGLRTRMRRWRSARRGVKLEREPRMEMYGIAERRLRAYIERRGGRVAHVARGHKEDPCLEGHFTWLALRLGWGLQYREYVVEKCG